MNSCASFHETVSTGHCPQPENSDGFVPVTPCHSACVTSCLPSQNPRLIRTILIRAVSECLIQAVIDRPYSFGMQVPQ